MELDTTLNVEWVSTERLFCSPSNPRKNDAAVAPVAASVRRFGWQQPIVARRSGEVLAGNTRLLAARELGPADIRVNTILPGWINNERGRRVVETKAQALGIPVDELMTEMTEFISLGCMIEPVEIANMALYLCSEAGRHISGQAIGVCGNVEYER